jgi:predicted CxxxxCH...CXXCH cytochrome family protein
MSRGHWPHVGTPGAGGTANSMGYACEVCHSNVSSRHNGSNNFTGSWWDNVDVQFASALNPAFAGGGPTYGGQNAYGGSYAQGVLNGTANGVCAGLYCHGDNPDKNLMWEGAAKQPAWTGTVACGDCHRAGSNLRQGNHAVHVDNTGANARGPGGIAVFGGNCLNGAATGCHTAYGKTPTTTHARGTATFRTSPASGAATDNNGTLVCNSCHSTQIVAYLDNGAANTTTTGVAFAKGNWVDNTYRLPCLTCHNNGGQTSGATANAKMDGTGAWAPNIEKYWRASGHGFSLQICPQQSGNIDNCSTTDTTTPNVYQKLPVPCGYCHDINSRHFGNTTANGNAWRLLSSSGYSTAEGLDKFCALQCHGGSEAGTSWACDKPNISWDHFWIGGCSKDSTDTHASSRSVIWQVEGIDKTKDPNIPTQNYMPLESDIRSGGGAIFLCVTCHDPHGTGAGDGVHWDRSFAGANTTSPVDNVHMLRYEHTNDLCRKCHL